MTEDRLLSSSARCHISLCFAVGRDFRASVFEEFRKYHTLNLNRPEEDFHILNCNVLTDDSTSGTVTGIGAAPRGTTPPSHLPNIILGKKHIILVISSGGGSALKLSAQDRNYLQCLFIAIYVFCDANAEIVLLSDDCNCQTYLPIQIDVAATNAKYTEDGIRNMMKFMDVYINKWPKSGSTQKFYLISPIPVEKWNLFFTIMSDSNTGALTDRTLLVVQQKLQKHIGDSCTIARNHVMSMFIPEWCVKKTNFEHHHQLQVKSQPQRLSYQTQRMSNPVIDGLKTPSSCVDIISQEDNTTTGSNGVHLGDMPSNSKFILGSPKRKVVSIGQHLSSSHIVIPEVFFHKPIFK